jgi:hypothetical protein
MDSTGSRSDWFSGIAAAATGMGILTFTFFPLAIPILLLTAVAALVLVVPLIALAAIVGILIGAFHVLRAAGRGIRLLGRGAGGTSAAREISTWSPRRGNLT